jgi:hypothetical protein
MRGPKASRGVSNENLDREVPSPLTRAALKLLDEHPPRGHAHLKDRQRNGGERGLQEGGEVEEDHRLGDPFACLVGHQVLAPVEEVRDGLHGDVGARGDVLHRRQASSPLRHSQPKPPLVGRAGLPPEQVTTLVGFYSDAQIDALKHALLVASMFAFIGLWFAQGLPGEALAAEARVPSTAVPDRT